MPSMPTRLCSAALATRARPGVTACGSDEAARVLRVLFEPMTFRFINAGLRAAWLIPNLPCYTTPTTRNHP